MALREQGVLKYRGEAMVNGVLGSCLLKSQCSFKLSLQRAVPFIVPAPLQEHLLHMLRNIALPVPSRWPFILKPFGGSP